MLYLIRVRVRVGVSVRVRGRERNRTRAREARGGRKAGPPRREEGWTSEEGGRLDLRGGRKARVR